jgi:hypothetical protein
MHLESMRELTNQVLEEEKIVQGASRSKSNRRGASNHYPSPYKVMQPTANSIEQIGCIETPLGLRGPDYETRLDLQEGVELMAAASGTDGNMIIIGQDTGINQGGRLVRR